MLEEINLNYYYWRFIKVDIIFLFMKTDRSRQKVINTCAIIGIVANLSFSFLKFVAGTITKSVAITNDAINNLSDSLSSLITLLGYRMGKMKPTRKHPLGYGRTEYLSAMIISIIILVAGYDCFISSIDRLKNPSGVSIAPIAVIILILSVLTKIALSILNTKAGKKVDSEALKTSGKDALSDVLVTSLTIISLIAGKFTTFPVDGVMGIIVSLFIFYAGISSFLETNSALMGERPDKETVEKIRFIIKKHPPLKGGYDIMLHSYGPERCMGTCNVEVPTRAHAENIFDAMTDASKEIEEELGIYFTFGLFAVNDYREDVRALKNDILEYLKEKTPHVISLHAFHVHIESNLVHFDVVVDFKVSNYGLYKEEILKALNDKWPNYTFEFTIDPEYD